MADDSNTNDSKNSAALKRGKTLKKPEGRSRSGLLTGGLALIFSAIALIGTAYLGYELLLQRGELLKTDVVGDLDKLKDDAKTLQESFAGASSTLDEVKSNQDGIRAALEKIQNDLSRHRTEWTLAEAEQLLVISNNRLQLARDVRSALAALRAADAQLNLLSNPSLLPVRREIAREIALLETLDKIDVGGMSLKLGSLAEAVERLPIAPEVSRRAQAALQASAELGTTTDTQPTQPSWARSLLRDLLSLVRVRTDLTTQRPLLPPEQEYFLRENLKLMLYSAQAALLQGNTAVFQQNLKVAQQLLKDYYDSTTQIVTGMQAELDKMRTSKLVTELPDISQSLAALRAAARTRSAP